MQKTVSLVIGLLFFVFGMGFSTVNSKASKLLNPAYYHPKLLGYMVPRALRGKWYYRGKLYHADTHHFYVNHYYYDKKTKGRVMISHQLVKMFWGISAHTYKARGYYDGAMFSNKLGGWDFGEMYTPVIFCYKGHNHKGIDITGHAPDLLLTRKPTHNNLSFDGYYATKVKLVKIGW